MVVGREGEGPLPWSLTGWRCSRPGGASWRPEELTEEIGEVWRRRRSCDQRLDQIALFADGIGIVVCQCQAKGRDSLINLRMRPCLQPLFSSVDPAVCPVGCLGESKRQPIRFAGCLRLGKKFRYRLRVEI